MGEDSARSNEQIKGHVVDDRSVARVLSEGVADRPLLLHARQRRRELLVLDVREPQRLARDRLLEHQRFQCLRNRRRADHLVLHAVPQFPLVAVVGHPAQDHRQRRFGEDVRDRIAHPQIRAHRAVERPVEDAEDVGCRAADIDSHRVDPLQRGDRLEDVAHCTGGRHDRSIGP